MNAPNSKPKRRRWRFLTQFSLRSLLVLVTLVAALCWWFLRPEARDEQLADKYLTLRRQVRVKVPPAGQTLPQDLQEKADKDDWLVSHGVWRVREEHSDLVIDGRYADGLPHGKWTVYHVNGQKAAQGQVFGGARTGLWRSWDEEGTLRSEMTYKAVEEEQLPPLPRPLVNHWPTVRGGVIHLPLAQFGGGMMGGGGPGPANFPRSRWGPTHVAHRNGPAKVWNSSGRLQLEGAYQDDLRDGLWTTYDEQGRIKEQGRYRAGVREGDWKSFAPSSKQAATREYVAGLSAHQRDKLIARWNDALQGAGLNRKIAAAQRLGEVGSAGVPALIRALRSPDAETQVVALRALGRQQPVPELAIPEISLLADSADSRVALRARLAIYLCSRDQRSRWFTPLIESLDAAGDELAFEALLAMYRADADRRLAILVPLVERMGRAVAAYDGSALPPGYVAQQLGDLGWDIVPQLDAIYPQASSEARWFSILVLQHLVLREEPSFVLSPGGNRRPRWEVPPAGLPLLKRAESDPDPRVQEAAFQLGRQFIQPTTSAGAGGFGGQAGGFF
jgi:hypothetical protein